MSATSPPMPDTIDPSPAGRTWPELEQPLPIEAERPAPHRRRRPRFRTRRTAAWTVAKLLLFAAFVGLGAAAYLVTQPVVNPGVQDCGSSIGFFLSGEHDVVLHPGEPGAPANAVALASQPTCRDLASLEIQKASIGVAAFFVFGFLGIAIGLIDDRVEYWRAPNFETLLKPMPREERIRYGLVPKVQVDDLGSVLPPLETPELWGIAIIGGLTFLVLPLFGPLTATQAAASNIALLPILVGAVLTALLFGAAAVQRKSVYPEDDAWSRIGELVLASSFSGRLRPVVGTFGIDIHHLRKSGLSKRDAVLDVHVLQTVSAVVHVLLLGWTFLVFEHGSFDAGTFFEQVAARDFSAIGAPFFLLVALIVFVLSSLQRLVRRIRALPSRPSWEGLRGVFRVSGSIDSALLLVGATVAISVISAFVLIASLTAFGGTLPFLSAVFIVLASVTVGAMVTSPNGLGGFEATMALLLMAAGVDSGVAIAATLLYRVLTLWLPMVPGWRASRSLHAVGAL